MKRFLLLLFILAPGLGRGALPGGVSALITAESSISSAVQTNPSVDYASLALHWDTAEPTEGSYNFTYFGNGSHTGVIQVAAAAGKKSIIGVGGQNGPHSSGGLTPDWVYTSALGVTLPITAKIPGKVFLDSSGGVFIVFYNSIFFGKETDLINAFANWFYNTGPLTSAERASVVCVRVAFCANNGFDWSISGSNSGDITQWQTDHLYTTVKLHDAGININNTGLIDVTMAAFPDKYVNLAFGSNGNTLDAAADAAWNGGVGYGDPKDFLAYEVITEALAKYPGRFIVQKNSLAAKTPAAPGAPPSSLGLLYTFSTTSQTSCQALWNVYNDTSVWRMCNNNNTPEDPDNPGFFLTQDEIFNRFIAKADGYVNTINEIYDYDIGARPNIISNAWAAFHTPITPGRVTLRAKP